MIDYHTLKEARRAQYDGRYSDAVDLCDAILRDLPLEDADFSRHRCLVLTLKSDALQGAGNYPEASEALAYSKKKEGLHALWNNQTIPNPSVPLLV